MTTILTAVNAGLAAARAVTPTFIDGATAAPSLKPHGWYLARFLGSESEPANPVAMPYLYVPGRSGAGTGILRQGHLMSVNGVPELHARWYEYPARFEIGPEMSPDTVISWLVDFYRQKARQADLSALTSLLARYMPGLVPAAQEKYPGLLG